MEAAQVLEPARTLEEVECRHILDVLGQTGWRITVRAGRLVILDVKPATPEYRMKELGIERKHLAVRLPT